MQSLRARPVARRVTTTCRSSRWSWFARAQPTRRRSPAYRLLRGAGLLFFGWLAAMAAAVIAMRWIDPPTTAFMLRDRFDALATGERGYTFRYQWRDWSAIAADAGVAVIAAEDQAFPLHDGFDFRQIDRALADRE